MSLMESATYGSRSGPVNMSAAQPTPNDAQMPKITHFGPKAKGRSSMLQMAAGATADVPNTQRRSLITLALLGGAGLSIMAKKPNGTDGD